MALCLGLPGWAWTRKEKPVWILVKQETTSVNGIHWAICKSAPRSSEITTPVPHHSSFFIGQMPFLPPNQQRQSTEGRSCLYHDYIIRNWHQRAAWRDKWSFAVCDERMRPGLWLGSVLCVFFGVLILMVRWQKGHMTHKTCSTNSQSFSFMDEEYERATYLV